MPQRVAYHQTSASTMHELTAPSCDAIRPLFAEMTASHSVVFAPLEGYNPGHVFVDDPDEPRSVCVAMGDTSYTGDVFFGGSAESDTFNADVRAFLTEEVMPSLVANEEEGHMMLVSATEAWRQKLDSLMEAHGVRRIVRTLFRLDVSSFRERHAEWRSRIPNGYRVVRADRDLAAQIPGVAELWGSVDHFIEKGFGFCVVDGERVVSRCQPVFIGDGRAELGVGTDKEYRRRGLATLAGCACVEHCLDVGLAPEWGCFYNEASGGVARKLGFVQQPDLEVNYVRVTR